MLETQRLTRQEVMKKLKSFGKKNKNEDEDETHKKKKHHRKKNKDVDLIETDFDNVDIEEKDDSI